MVSYLSESVRLAATGSARKKIEDFRTRAARRRHRRPHLLRPGRWTNSAPVPRIAAGRRSGWTRGRPGGWTTVAIGISAAPVCQHGTDSPASHTADRESRPAIPQAARLRSGRARPLHPPAEHGPRGLRFRAPKSPRASASAGSNYRCKSSMPPAGLPPAGTAPDFAAPRLKADSSPSPPAAQPHTALFAVEARLGQDRKDTGPDPCSPEETGRGVQPRTGANAATVRGGARRVPRRDARNSRRSSTMSAGCPDSWTAESDWCGPGRSVSGTAWKSTCARSPAGLGLRPPESAPLPVSCRIWACRPSPRRPCASRAA